jgi:hypothetical protein
MAMANWRMTRTLRLEKLDFSALIVFFKLSIAFDEEIFQAGIMLKITLIMRMPASDAKIKLREYVNFGLKRIPVYSVINGLIAFTT